jgi:HlyD family secretion protein
VAGAEATAADLVLTAPVDGVVLTRAAEPGEVLPAGQAAFTVGEVRRPWVRVYLGPDALASLRVGTPVEGVVDGAPDRVFRGRVVALATEAEFTPRVALTERERRDLLFAVRVAFEDSSETLKAGLPVTVRRAP